MSIDQDTPLFLEDSQAFIFNCPHCQQVIYVANTEINCKIFRHGIYKHDYRQINPHETKERCEQLIKEDLIYGCGKPFYFDGTTAKVCDYI